MFLRMIYDEKLAAASYLIGCQKTGEAIVIDPQRDIDRYLALAAAHGLKVTAAAETHIHADFLSGSRELAERGARVYLSGEGDADWQYQWVDKRSGGGSYDAKVLKDGDTFRVGNIEFKTVHTPGHTPEHICFMVTDRGSGADRPIGVATGDFVFVGDLGRPDLLETAAGFRGAAEPAARRLHGAVRTFMSWPDYLQVWPAHGAGSACGKALGAVPQSTVGYEKLFSPAIRAAATEREFVQFILEGQPEPPVYFARMKRDNKLGPRLLGELPRPRRLTPAQFGAIDGRRCAIIDTRPWAAFRAGHAPGSLFHPLNSSFTTDVGSMVREDEAIYLVVEPARLEEAVRDLVRIGLDDIRGWIDPAGLAETTGAGGKLESTRQVPPDEARRMLASARPPIVLDVRRASEHAEGAIPGAINIAHTRLIEHLEEVPEGRDVIVHCKSGGRSARACALLQKHGRSVMNLDGGFHNWVATAVGAKQPT